MLRPAQLSRLVPRSSRTLPSRCRQYATVTKTLNEDTSELDNVTTLSNGVRVASESLSGPFSAVGVYVDAGSRYENEALRGVSHIIDRLAFKSTSKRSSDNMLETIESLGGNIQCASSRESLMYQAATFNSAVPTTIALLAETIRDANITDEEVERQLETAEYEIGEIWSKPELILPELVHMAAYKDNTLGNPLLCPAERLPQIDRRTVEAYRSAFFRPERLVVAFAGVEHAEAVRLAEQHFGDMKSTITTTASPDQIQSTPQNLSPQDKSGLMSKIPFFKNAITTATDSVSPLDPSQIIPHPLDAPLDYTSPSRYTGGFLTLPDLPIPPSPALPRLSHIHLAFESYPINSDSIYALATLQTLLGGGGSFSAGGPGKGMYSRLYTGVLNQHAWVENCVAFNHAYTDSGIFGISASCSTPFTMQMLQVMCLQLMNLGKETGIGRLMEGEVKRAKNQLKSSLLMNLESRMVELEDLGRQVQVHGRKVSVQEMMARIDKVDIPELRRVAREVLGGQVKNAGNGSGAPTVVVQQGMEEGVKLREVKWDEVQSTIAKYCLGKQ
ncbi:Metalloenzyme, LuxS/M16 peptidase-like protein [Delphinella strobiligena]|nr:Metalloenzyme, LuxS/M16 peptidase-like protein [Delphinella strobiligena]